jgi:phage gp36-like protein
MFITKADITSSGIHSEILEALSRNSDITLNDIIAISIDEMGGYLASRFDIVNIFNKTGSDRNQSIKQKLIDIVLYHIHSKGNPSAIPDIRVKRYDDAIEWLKGVQSGSINPPGLPLREEESVNSMMSYGSNPRRVNHY